MSRIDLHPEDLIDREALGELTPREEQHLEEHRSHCVACVLEDELHADFELELEQDEEDDEVLERVLDRVIPTQRTRRAQRPQPLLRVAVAAAVMLISVGAAGAAWQVYVAWTENPPESTPPISSNGETAEPEPQRRETPRPRSMTPPTPQTTIPEEAGDAPSPVVEEAPGPESSVEIPVGRPDSSSILPPTPRSESWETPSDPTATEIFRRANRARGEGRVHEAARLYRQLSREHQGTREEIASRVSLARLLLDRLGDPQGALSLFDSYLAVSSTGNMAQEARVGRALCLGRLGRPDEETRAWRELLRHHPRSVHATRARDRLELLRRSQDARNRVETHR